MTAPRLPSIWIARQKALLVGCLAIEISHFYGAPYRGAGGIIQARIAAVQILYKNFVRNWLGVFKDLCRCERPLFLINKYWEPYIICSLIFKKWHRFCRARICRFIFSPARNIPPPPRYLWKECLITVAVGGKTHSM